MKKTNKIFIVIIAILIILTIIITLIGANQNKTVHKINNTEFYEIIKNKSFTLIDVRTKEEYNTGHIENALNIPLDDIANINLDKSTKIAVYCRTGKRSSEAALQLEKMGYNNIYDLGGISNKEIELTK